MSDRKQQHFDKLDHEYREALAEVEANQGKRRTEYLQKIKKEGCFHPTQMRHTYKEDRDDGYGRWWRVEVTRCRLCSETLETKYL